MSLREVVLISNGFQPDYEAGFANGVAANGRPATLISSDRTLTSRLDRAVTSLNFRGAQDRDRMPLAKLFNLVRYWVRLCWYLLRRRPIVHMTGLLSLGHTTSHWAVRTWHLECRLLKALSSRLIYTVHNVVPHHDDSPFVRRHLRAVYRIPDRLVVHTNRARERLIDEFGVAPERIVVMEHGIDSLAVCDPSARSRVRGEIGVQPGGCLILFFGSVLPYKGVDFLVGAAPHLGDAAHVHIAGYCGDRRYEKELDSAIERSPVRDRISFEKGFLTEERVSELLCSADVLAMPYRGIDQSGVLFAAMRHGLPVVAFDVGSFADYLRGPLGTVVPPGDTAALATALRTFARADVPRDNIQTVARRYLWSNTVRPVLEEYDRRPA